MRKTFAFLIVIAALASSASDCLVVPEKMTVTTLLCAATLFAATDTIFNVREFGATGGGVTADSADTIIRDNIGTSASQEERK